jgi:molybdopterin converting factor small subunit
MAKVTCNRLLLDFIEPAHRPAEESVLDIRANNVRTLIQKLGQQFPGLEEKLQHGFAVAIDGEIFADPMLEPLDEQSEVYFLPAIEGG